MVYSVSLEPARNHKKGYKRNDNLLNVLSCLVQNMEEVDRIIIHSLKDIGCEIEDDVERLEEFTTERVIDAVVRCLEVIHPEIDIPRSLPQNMAARFHLGTSIAEACKGLGYNGDVGYQTFLYSNVVDVRRVFMFLIDKLPRETEKVTYEPEDAASRLKLEISRETRRRLELRRPAPRVSNIPFVSVPLETGILPPGARLKGNPKDWREYVVNELGFLTEQASPRRLLPSIISLNSDGSPGNSGPRYKELPASTSTSDFSKSLSSISSDHHHTWLSLTQNLLFSREPSSGVGKCLSEDITQTTDVASKEATHDEPLDAEAASDESVEGLRLKIEELQGKIKETNSFIEKVGEECRRERRNERRRRRELARVEEAVELLPEAEVKLAELKEAIGSLAERMLSLASRWESYRQPLLNQYHHLKSHMANRESQNDEEQEQVNQLRMKIESLNKQLLGKRGIILQLQEEYDKLPKNINRSAYTRRIMEIIGNISKQKEQIDKILSDTKQLQKETNTLTGRLERSFAVVEETIYRNAKKDEFSKKSFKLLATLHSDCATIVSLVLEIGTISREITDLKEQIEFESRKNTTANLERIRADLEQMRKESKSLKSQMSEQDVSESHPLL